MEISNLWLFDHLYYKNLLICVIDFVELRYLLSFKQPCKGFKTNRYL